VDLLTLYTLISAVFTAVAFAGWIWQLTRSKHTRKWAVVWLSLCASLLILTIVFYRTQRSQPSLGEESAKTRAAISEEFSQTRAQVKNVQETTDETQRLLRAVRAAIDQALRVTELPNPSLAAVQAQIQAFNLARTTAEKIPDIATRRSWVAEIARAQAVASERAQTLPLNTIAQPPATISTVPAKTDGLVSDANTVAAPKRSELLVLLPPAPARSLGATETPPSKDNGGDSGLLEAKSWSYIVVGNPLTGPVTYDVTIGGQNFDPLTVAVTIDGAGCDPGFISTASLTNKSQTRITLPGVTLPDTGCTVTVTNGGNGQSFTYPFPISPHPFKEK
jgi:hypothetical protein